MRPALRHWWLAHLTTVLLAATRALLPARHADWGRAMQAEVLAIGDASQALAYAWGCFTAALAWATQSRLMRLRQPDGLGLACAGLVVGLGCTFMATRQAPGAYAWVNGLSFAVAWASFRLLPRARLQRDGHGRAVVTFALGALLLWAALPQAGHAGPEGWLRLGPLWVQPTWLLCPVWWAVSAPLGGLASPPSAPRALNVAGLAMGLVALAQHAQAPLLAITTLLLAARAVRATTGAHAALALLALGLTVAALSRWTAPPPSPFVDEVLQLAFTHSTGLGALLAMAWLTLLLPGVLHRGAREHSLTWAALLALALPGWLPAPVLGFGGSFIMGYVLSLAALPDGRTATRHHPGAPVTLPPARDAPSRPRVGLA